MDEGLVLPHFSQWSLMDLFSYNKIKISRESHPPPCFPASPATHWPAYMPTMWFMLFLPCLPTCCLQRSVAAAELVLGVSSQFGWFLPPALSVHSQFTLSVQEQAVFLWKGDITHLLFRGGSPFCKCGRPLRFSEECPCLNLAPLSGSVDLPGH